MAFDSSVGRAQAKVAAPVAELRLALGIHHGFHRDLLLRRYACPEPARDAVTSGYR